MASPTTSGRENGFPEEARHDHPLSADSASLQSPSDREQSADTVDRRDFLVRVLSAGTLTIAATMGAEPALATHKPSPTTKPGAKGIPGLPTVPEVFDLGDSQNLAAKPTSLLLVLEITKENRVKLVLPRTEVGQGITTAIAMLVAEELDARLSDVDIPLSDARPELIFNQLTGGSNTIRSQWEPVRTITALARARLVTAAAQKWKLPADQLRTKDTKVIAPDGRTATYGSLSAAAAKVLAPTVSAKPKSPKDYRIVGKPTSRIDARAMVTGKQKYTLDLEVPGAKPTMVRRPPTINGTVKAVQNEAAVRKMPGVIDVAVVATGVAVMAETFGQALDAKEALKVTWNGGTIDGLSDADLRKKLRATAKLLPVLPALTQHVDGEFDFAAVSHAPLETNSAIADVRADRAEIWSTLKSPIVAQAEIAKAIGLPISKVKVHVTQGGGSFGRRLFPEAAVEAARISKKMKRPVKLMWSRIDDMRHGRKRPNAYQRIRATFAAGKVLTYEQRTASIQTDFDHSYGDAITSALPKYANLPFAETIFTLSQEVPYEFGVVTNLLNEVPLKISASSWRSIYSGTTAVAQEIMVDEIAKKLGKDPLAFRRSMIKSPRHKAVLDKLAAVGDWGRKMPAGHAQGIGFHSEYRSAAAYLVEIDASDKTKPRVTKAVIVADVGRPINPRGLEGQLIGCLTDGISTILRAGLHIEDGLPLEGSYSQFHYARQKDIPPKVEIHLMPANGEPGGAGELAVPAAGAAVANAYARATNTKPRSFPIIFPVDFTPFPK